MPRLAKTGLVALAGSVVLILASAWIVSTVLRGPLIELCQRELTARFAVEVSFDDADVSLLPSFPALALEVAGLEVVGTGSFEGVTLATAALVHLETDLRALLLDDEVVIESARIERPEIHLIAREDGEANYDLVEKTPTDEHDAAETDSVRLELRRVVIVGGALSAKTPTAEVRIEGLEHEGSATAEGPIYSGTSSTTIESLTLRIGRSEYIDRSKATLETSAVLDAEQLRLEIDSLGLSLNELSATVEGGVDWSGEAVTVDLQLASGRGQSIRALVSAIPGAYSGNLEGLRASGTYSLHARVDGRMPSHEGQAPPFSASLRVRNGKLQYRGLPLPLDGIEVAARLNHPGGHLDKMTIDVRQLSVRAGQSHVEAKVSLSKPLSKPYVEATLNGRVNLAELSRAYPLSDEAELRGNVGFQLDLATKGERARRLTGWMTATALAYLPKHAPHLHISAASLSFAPKVTNLDSFYGTYGRSDLKVSGTLSPLTTIVRQEQPLVGDLTLDSRFVNLDDFLEGEDTEIPHRLDITINGSAQKLQRRKIVLSHMRGLVLIRNGEVKLTNVRTDTHRKQVESLLATLPKAKDVCGELDAYLSCQPTVGSTPRGAKRWAPRSVSFFIANPQTSPLSRRRSSKSEAKESIFRFESHGTRRQSAES